MQACTFWDSSHLAYDMLILATKSGLVPKERLPITVFEGLVITSATGAKFKFIPYSFKYLPVSTPILFVVLI